MNLIAPSLPRCCQNCQRETAKYRIVIYERPTNVCRKCVAANEGRPGWPYLEDLPSQILHIHHGSD